jgi:hypothetical protein
MSTQQSEFAKALIQFQSECSIVEKNARNPHFKSEYADLEQIIKATREPLKKANLCFIQGVSMNEQGQEVFATRIIHVSGESELCTCLLGPYKNIQEKGSLITYLRRYQLISMLGISGGDVDDDGELLVAPTRQAETKPIQPQQKPLDNQQPLIPKEFSFIAIKYFAGKSIKDIDSPTLLKQLEFWSDKAVKPNTQLDNELKAIDKELKGRK